jgi:hypothetical protein
MNSKQRNKNRATARELFWAVHLQTGGLPKGTVTGRFVHEHKPPIHSLPPEPVSKDTIRLNGRYNWKYQPERLVYVGRAHYPGDRRDWFQFEKVDKPGEVWCEVLDSDLPSFEQTKMEGDMRS